MTDGAALYAAILAAPADDTLRLVYADWLQENGDPDRAELVRLQIEFVRVLDGFRRSEIGCIDMYCDPDDRDEQAWKHKVLGLHRREKELSAAHPEWSRLQCDNCQGTGYAFGAPFNCRTCSGTGDLFTSRAIVGHGSWTRTENRTVTFRGGFPDAVSCTLAELGSEREVTCRRCRGSRGFHDHEAWRDCRVCSFAGVIREFAPTPWAAAVVKAVPVTRFVLTDREPFFDGRLYLWFRQHPEGHPGIGLGHADLPAPVFDALPSSVTGISIHETEAAAIGALALAAGSLVREVVCGKAVRAAPPG